DPADRREVAVAVPDEARGEEVGIDEIEGVGAEVEDREDAALQPNFPLPPLALVADIVAIDRDTLAEADGGHVLRPWRVDVVPVRGREVGPARIGDERLEEVTRRQKADRRGLRRRLG